MKYSEIIGIEPFFDSTFNMTEEKENYWKQFITNEKFESNLKEIVNVFTSQIGDQHKSIWVQGTYGTGKSHSTSVIKHLLSDDLSDIADYIEKVNAISGVGNTKVFPAWQYNGSVLLSVVDPTYNPISAEFARNLKEQIDPEEESGNGIGIAPIGHFVTITTPVEMTVDVELTLETAVDSEIGEIHQQVEEIIENYFDSVRRQFAQNVRLALYRAKIIELILSNVSEVLNVTDVLLNNSGTDIVYTDEGQIDMQYLPKLGEVTLN